MTVATLSKTLSGIVLVSLCAIALTGCAQFEDSFGELWSPEPRTRIAGASNSEDLAGPRDRSDQDSSRENRNSASANGARSFTIGGVRVELAEGQMNY